MNRIESDFDTIHREYGGYMYTLALRLTGNAHDADDVYQDACVRSYRFLPSYRGGSLKSWLRTITVNVFRSRFRRNLREEAYDDVDHTLGSLREEPGQIMADNQLGPELSAALQSIPQEMREVLVLRVMEDLSYQEIADLLVIPIGTVRSRLARARAALLLAMQKQGGSP